MNSWNNDTKLALQGGQAVKEVLVRWNQMLADHLCCCQTFSVGHYKCKAVSIKTQSMCRAAQEAGAPHRECIDRKKASFSHLCISVIPYPIGTKCAAELPASQGSLHSKFEGNRSNHFRDTSCQSFDFFSSLFFLRVFAHLQKLL